MSTVRAYEFFCDRVVHEYFHAVDNGNMDAALACFHPQALLREMTSGTEHRGRDEGIRRMLTDFCAAHERIWHGNFVLTVDPDNESVAVQFSVEVTPTGGALMRYENCNRFYLEQGLFREVYIYMSGDNLLR